MSLLLDALKRAEEANKAKEGGTTTEGAVASSRVPVVFPTSNETAAPGESTLEESVTPAPVLSLVEEPGLAPPVPRERKDNTAELSGSAPIGSSNADNAAKREAVRNVFAVKQHAPLSPTERRKPVLILVLGAVVVTVLSGGGWYMWRELSKLSRPTITRPAPMPPSPIVSPSPAETRSASSEPLPPLLPPDKPAALAVTKAGALPATDREAVAALAMQAPSPIAPSLKWQRVDQAEAPAGVAPTIAAAYAALQAGQWATAKRLYAQVLAVQPGSVDAHLGLAAIAARQGEHDLARRHYGRVLEIDPSHVLAAGALAALGRHETSGVSEADLRTLIARSPDTAVLHFVLGNKLAADRRWVDAQEAYFEAARLDPANADFAFNLAVSLDQLGQKRAAANQYRRALSLGGGQFDVGLAQHRLKMLAENMAAGDP